MCHGTLCLPFPGALQTDQLELSVPRPQIRAGACQIRRATQVAGPQPARPENPGIAPYRQWRAIPSHRQEPEAPRGTLHQPSRARTDGSQGGLVSLLGTRGLTGMGEGLQQHSAPNSSSPSSLVCLLFLFKMGVCGGGTRNKRCAIGLRAAPESGPWLGGAGPLEPICYCSGEAGPASLSRAWSPSLGCGAHG